MRAERFHADALVRLLRKRTVATMVELKAALGTKVDMTVFRKLREIPYLSSYSHSGKFYTLRELAKFDGRGLWSYHDVRFSSVGTLLDTAEQFVCSSERGYLAAELASELEVEVKEPLLQLVRAERLTREEVSGVYVYCSAEPSRRRQQLLARRLPAAEEPFGVFRSAGTEAPEEVRAAILLFVSALNEKQRRLYLGLESLRLGRGGDRRLAEWTGLDAHTVAKGRRELLARDLDLDRIRRRGGGRRSVEKKRPK